MCGTMLCCCVSHLYDPLSFSLPSHLSYLHTLALGGGGTGGGTLWSPWPRPLFSFFSLLKRQMDKVYCKVGSALGKTAQVGRRERIRTEEREGNERRCGCGWSIRNRMWESERRRALRCRWSCWLRVQLQLLRTLLAVQEGRRGWRKKEARIGRMLR